MPVGPTGQWKLMAETAIKESIDLSKLYIVSMDEYLLEDGITAVPEDNPFSFKAFINESFANTAMSKCGFKKEGIFEKAITKFDKIYDEHRYALIRGRSSIS